MVVAPTVAAAFCTLMSLEKACSRLLLSGVDASSRLEGSAAHLLAPCSIAWASSQARDALFFFLHFVPAFLTCPLFFFQWPQALDAQHQARFRSMQRLLLDGHTRFKL